MELSELKRKIREFDQNAGFDKTSLKELIAMIEKETLILKNNFSDKSVVNHQLTDLLVLVMQIAHRYQTDFDKELAKWFDKSKKYLK